MVFSPFDRCFFRDFHTLCGSCLGAGQVRLFSGMKKRPEGRLIN